MTDQTSIETELREQLGKDASAILDKVERLQKDGKPRSEIEKVLAKAICDHVLAQVGLIVKRSPVTCPDL